MRGVVFSNLILAIRRRIVSRGGRWTICVRLVMYTNTISTAVTSTDTTMMILLLLVV